MEIAIHAEAKAFPSTNGSLIPFEFIQMPTVTRSDLFTGGNCYLWLNYLFCDFRQLVRMVFMVVCFEPYCN